MARISIDNGATWTTPAAALDVLTLDAIAAYMDDETREAVHAAIAPCSDVDFLAAYLDRAAHDLIIG